MNRQQRRNAGIREKPKTYTLTDAQIKQMKNQATTEAMDRAFILMLGIPCMALRDEYGFGKKRLTRFMDKLLDVYDSFNQGYVSLDDLIKTIEKETGVKLCCLLTKIL